MLLTMFNFYFFLFFFISNTIFPQGEKERGVDELLVLSKNNSNKNNIKALYYAKKASVIAERINNSEKKAYSYVYISESFVLLSNYKGSLEYISKAINEDYTDTDVLLQAKIKKVQAYNYSRLGFDSEALKKNYEILELLKEKSSEESCLLKFTALYNIGSHYYILDNNNKALNYLNRAEKMLKEKILLPINVDCELADLYEKKGDLFLYADKNDLALFYIKRAYNLVKNKAKVTKYSQYSAMGDYYYKINSRRLAINYYLKALESMYHFGVDDDVFKADIYNRLGYQYHFLGDTENEKKYQQKYFLETTISLDRKNKSIELASNIIRKEKEKQISSLSSLYFTLIILLAIFLSIGIIRYRIAKKKKNYLLYIKNKEINEREKALSEKEKENFQLKNKLIYPIEDIELMAKKNDPAFLASFQDKYPDFTVRLLEINPNLALSEIKFCALLSLNFTTKELATFTFISPKTVENKKTRIRKRLNIPNEIIISVWLRDLL